MAFGDVKELKQVLSSAIAWLSGNAGIGTICILGKLQNCNSIVV
jgi:hypothetical protein